MNDNANLAAFANPGSDQGTGSMGLSKREYFAAMAMQGLLNHYGATDHRYKNDKLEALAEKSITIADELLKQLEPKQ